MVKIMRFVFIVFVISLPGMRAAEAQERKRSISGHVMDVNHDALVGARVEVQPNGYAVTTDAQGAFTISDLAPGKYTLTVSYVGFKTFSKDVTIDSADVTNADAALEIETVNQQVIVRGEREQGEGKYVQVRGTEPRLTNLTLDGVHVPSPESVRQVKLDAIPADLVDSVEINKTLSPSQEGDAI